MNKVYPDVYVIILYDKSLCSRLLFCNLLHVAAAMASRLEINLVRLLAESEARAGDRRTPSTDRGAWRLEQVGTGGTGGQERGDTGKHTE